MRNIKLYLLLSLFALLHAGCRKELNPANADPEQFSISGKIENYHPAKGDVFAFGGMLMTDMGNPEVNRVFSIKTTKINTDGTFLLMGIPRPADSLFIDLNNSNGQQIYVNRGFLSASNHPFMHEYIVYGGLLYHAEQVTENTSIYASNSNYGKDGFISETAPLGTYRVCFDYIDQPYRYSAVKDIIYGGLIINYKYNLDLMKGWNKIYLVLTERQSNKLTVIVTTTPPENGYSWW